MNGCLQQQEWGRDYQKVSRLEEDPSLFTERDELFFLGCMVINLSWICDECKIVTGNHPRLFIAPQFLDLPSDFVPFYGIAIVTDRYHHNPINIQLVLAYDKFQAPAGVGPAGFENSVNLRFTFYNLFLRKASSHHIRTACVCLWLSCGPIPGDRPSLPYEP